MTKRKKAQASLCRSFLSNTFPAMRWIVFTAILAGSILFSGCASSDTPEDPNRVSTIPHNRPERWEGQGPLGGFMPGQY